MILILQFEEKLYLCLSSESIGECPKVNESKDDVMLRLRRDFPTEAGLDVLAIKTIALELY